MLNFYNITFTILYFAYLCIMKKSRFTIVILCSIFSLVFLATAEIFWAVDTYRNMHDALRKQLESILDESSWKYILRQTNGNYTLPNIARLQTILQEELRTSGIDGEFMVEVLTNSNGTPTAIWSIGGERLSKRVTTFDKSFTPLILRLTVDDPHSIIMASMRWMLILQLLSIIILTLSFAYLLNTLFRAKSLEQIRRDLTHNITHELKTPIAAAYVATDALRTSHVIADNEAMRNEYLDMSLASLKRLEYMVNEILRTSTEGFEERKLKLEQCTISDIVNEVYTTLNLKYSEREVNWVIDIPQSEVIVADRLYLTSAISALADNAIKYCPNKPLITIKLSSKRSTTTISISDNGVGIPNCERKRIFEKFYRISQGNRHDTKGYGLGLYYVKSIVEQHGGKISLKSTVGQGSTFEITLPTYGKATNINS